MAFVAEFVAAENQSWSCGWVCGDLDCDMLWNIHNKKRQRKLCRLILRGYFIVISHFFNHQFKCFYRLEFWDASFSIWFSAQIFFSVGICCLLSMSLSPKAANMSIRYGNHDGYDRANCHGKSFEIACPAKKNWQLPHLFGWKLPAGWTTGLLNISRTQQRWEDVACWFLWVEEWGMLPKNPLFYHTDSIL